MNIATAMALIILAVALRHSLADTFKNLAKVHASILLLLIPIEAWNYHSQSRLYQTVFRILGEKLPYSYLYRLSLELNFVNNTFPTGGASGLSYFAARLRKRNISVGRSSFVYIMKLAMIFFSFEILLMLGLVFLAAEGHINNIVIAAASFTSGVLLISTVGFIYIVGSQNRINATITALTQIANRVIHIFRRDHPETIALDRVQRVFEDFHQNYRLLKSHYEELLLPLWFGALFSITELAAIYVVFLAFGHWVNPGAIILAYAVSNFAGFVAILPGGIGMYEAIMVAVTVAAGIPASLSLAATVMYRVLNTLLQMPPGYYLYRQTLRSGALEAVQHERSEANSQ